MSFTCRRVCRTFSLAVSKPFKHLSAIHCRVSAPDFGARNILSAAPIPSPATRYAIVEVRSQLGFVASWTSDWLFICLPCEPPFRGCLVLHSRLRLPRGRGNARCQAIQSFAHRLFY